MSEGPLVPLSTEREPAGQRRRASMASGRSESSLPHRLDRRQFLARAGLTAAGAAAIAAGAPPARAWAQAGSGIVDWIPASTKTPKRGGTLTRASAWDPPVLDPRLTQSVGLYQFAGLTSNKL